MNYKALELKLRQSLESAIEKGWAPKPVFILGQRGTCCVLGSFVVHRAKMDHFGCLHGADGYEAYVANRLRVPRGVLTAIWKGFDARSDLEQPASEAESEAYAIGARIRRDYCEWTNE